MKRYNPNISVLFAAVILFGITLSSIHMHIDLPDDVDTKQSVIEEELNCVICGTVFKFSPSPDAYTIFYSTAAISLSVLSVEKAVSPFRKFKEGRSPPLF